MLIVLSTYVATRSHVNIVTLIVNSDKDLQLPSYIISHNINKTPQTVIMYIQNFMAVQLMRNNAFSKQTDR